MEVYRMNKEQVKFHWIFLSTTENPINISGRLKMLISKAMGVQQEQINDDGGGIHTNR